MALLLPSATGYLMRAEEPTTGLIQSTAPPPASCPAAAPPMSAPPMGQGFAPRASRDSKCCFPSNPSLVHTQEPDDTINDDRQGFKCDKFPITTDSKILLKLCQEAVSSLNIQQQFYTSGATFSQCFFPTSILAKTDVWNASTPTGRKYIICIIKKRTLFSLVFLLLTTAQKIATLLHTLPPKPCRTTFSLTPTCCCGSNFSLWKPEKRKATSNNRAKAMHCWKRENCLSIQLGVTKAATTNMRMKHPESQYLVIPQHLQGAEPPWGQHWTAPENMLMQGSKSSSSCKKMKWYFSLPESQAH